MINKPLCVGVVVLYNPDDKIIKNIDSYLTDIDKLYIIDNSELKRPELTARLKPIAKISYIDNGGNKGIGYALNLAAKLAIADQAEWLLTMDQDSRFERGALRLMLSYIRSADTSDIGIVSPLHVIPNKPRRYPEDSSPRQILTTATSGNLVNLAAFLKNGPYMEELFIDVVDHEYCLRLNANGYKIICLPTAKLNHQLGALKRESIMGIATTVTHHNYIRRYYITRNRLFVGKLYRKQFSRWCRHQTVGFWRDLLKIIFIEQDKKKKLKAVIRGIVDYNRGRLGKLD